MIRLLTLAHGIPKPLYASVPANFFIDFRVINFLLLF